MRIHEPLDLVVSSFPERKMKPKHSSWYLDDSLRCLISNKVNVCLCPYAKARLALTGLWVERKAGLRFEQFDH